MDVKLVPKDINKRIDILANKEPGIHVLKSLCKSYGWKPEKVGDTIVIASTGKFTSQEEEIKEFSLESLEPEEAKSKILEKYPDKNLDIKIREDKKALLITGNPETLDRVKHFIRDIDLYTGTFVKLELRLLDSIPGDSDSFIKDLEKVLDKEDAEEKLAEWEKQGRLKILVKQKIYSKAGKSGSIRTMSHSFYCTPEILENGQIELNDLTMVEKEDTRIKRYQTTTRVPPGKYVITYLTGKDPNGGEERVMIVKADILDSIMDDRKLKREERIDRHQARIQKLLNQHSKQQREKKQRQ